jgi:tRNA(Ile2) C34 agmatinyltransferase TiaS
MIFIGLDDTDTIESRGTGHLARQIAAALADAGYTISGVTRHQLLVDPRVPYTKNNSSATILIDAGGESHIAHLLGQAHTIILTEHQSGSDPGLCIAEIVPETVTEFGHKAQRQVVDKKEADRLAEASGVTLLGLGGTHDGIIGALAAVGLAASGNDGRYVLVGRSRELSGLQPVSALLEAGIAAVQTQDGEPVAEGLVLTDKLRPARRGGQPIAVVEWAGDHWLPLKLD